jgi:hypothetical protein
MMRDARIRQTRPGSRALPRAPRLALRRPDRTSGSCCNLSPRVAIPLNGLPQTAWAILRRATVGRASASTRYSRAAAVGCALQAGRRWHRQGSMGRSRRVHSFRASPS